MRRSPFLIIAVLVLAGCGQSSPEQKNADTVEAKIDKLIAQLKSSDPDKQTVAASALWEYGARAKRAIPALDDATNMGKNGTEFVTYHRELHQAVTDTLANMAPEAKEAIPPLVARLSGEFRQVAVAALVKYKEDAVPALIGALPNENAAQALGRIGAAAQGAVPMLIKVASGELRPKPGEGNAGAQSAAIQALGNIGAPARMAIPMLTHLHAQKMDDKNLAFSIVVSLFQIDAHNELARKALKGYQTHENPNFRATAYYHFARLDPADEASVHQLVTLYSTAGINRFMIHRYLGELGPRARELVPVLQKQLAREFDWFAAESLMSIDRATGTAYLIKTLESEDWDARGQAAHLLAKFHVTEALPALKKLAELDLGDDDDLIHEIAKGHAQQAVKRLENRP
ncbi:MAG: HEAT repeat domain-containing protein [Gemmataceae bacterium]